MFPAQIRELFTYPQSVWGTDASQRWVSLCSSLGDYQAPCRSLAISKERKWELVSAFQKSIRRGDKPMALRLVSAMDSLPEEYAYFRRRICVIGCEDLGPADDTLATFVVACNTVFPTGKIGDKSYDLLCFLTDQMCDFSTRSRIYCSYGMIEPAINKNELPELQIEDEPIISAIRRRGADVQRPTSAWLAWQKKNDWRAEKLLRFVGLRLPMEMTRVQVPVPPYRVLFDLPSNCYDVHTRSGLAMLKRLIQGVEGGKEIKEVFQQNKVKSPHKALGEALFFVEGGRIQGELIYEQLCSLEQRLSSYQFGLSLDTWFRLRLLVEKALEEGVIDRVREEVLDEFYGGKKNAIRLHENAFRFRGQKSEAGSENGISAGNV